jgi:carbon-monoxide dehydrogenase medium subunit
MSAIEQALIGETGDEDRLRDLCESCREIDAMGDVYASTEYRQHLATVMSRRALVKAYGRAAGTA